MHSTDWLSNNGRELVQRGSFLTQKRFALIAALAAVGVLGFSGCKKAPHPIETRPPDVEVLTITLEDMPVYQEWIGSLDGFINAQIRAQVSGYLLSQNYKEGAFVKKSDVLFQIDPRPFEAALNQAKGQLAVAAAQLGKAELDVTRYTPLVKENAISQEELDNAIQARLAGQASVEAAQAAVQQAQLNLDFSSVRSPVDGIAGLARAQLGDLVGPGSGELTTVSTVDPIKAYITVNEQYYLDHLAGYLGTNGSGGSELELELILANGSVYPRKGKFYFLNRQVEPGTGAMQVAVLYPNPGNVLRPGQYARIRARAEVRKGVALVPQRAVTELQGSFQVDIVDSSNKVQIRPVRLGQQMGGRWVVDDGLKAGDRVIVEGLQKVRQDALVNPHPAAAPK